ncbi:MAG: hypothetical protein WKG06_13365 [Segetibacter sp.]
MQWLTDWLNDMVKAVLSFTLLLITFNLYAQDKNIYPYRRSISYLNRIILS